MFHTEQSHENMPFKKLCVSCKTRKERAHFQPGKRQCNDCAGLSQSIRQKRLAAWRRQHGATAQRQWRERNPDYDNQYYHAHKQKKIAQVALGRAIRAGKLPRAAACACQRCGQPAQEYQIADCSRPLDATPVCRVCNRATQKQAKERQA